MSRPRMTAKASDFDSAGLDPVGMAQWASRAGFASEAKFTTAVLSELRKIPGTYWWRNNVGKRGYVSFGDLHSPDIEGILRGGRFVGLELKMPGEKPTAGQDAWHRRAIELGALIIVADNMGDAIRGVLEGMK